MDLLKFFNSYHSFRNIMKGSTHAPGWVRRWCFHPLADIVGTVAETHEDRFRSAMPDNAVFWDMLRKGYTFIAFTDALAGADLSNRGRALAVLGFASFLLRNWPQDSDVPLTERLDLLCVPLWSKIQIWQQTMKKFQEERAQWVANIIEEEEEDRSEEGEFLSSDSGDTGSHFHED